MKTKIFLNLFCKSFSNVFYSCDISLYFTKQEHEATPPQGKETHY